MRIQQTRRWRSRLQDSGACRRTSYKMQSWIRVAATCSRPLSALAGSFEVQNSCKSSSVRYRRPLSAAELVRSFLRASCTVSRSLGPLKNDMSKVEIGLPSSCGTRDRQKYCKICRLLVQRGDQMSSIRSNCTIPLAERLDLPGTPRLISLAKTATRVRPKSLATKSSGVLIGDSAKEPTLGWIR